MCSDLQFFPSQDMIKELQRRFDELVVIGSSKRTEKTEDLTVAFSGSYHACVGLIEIARMAVQTTESDDDQFTD